MRFSPNQTSGSYLLSILEARLEAAEDNAELEKRYELCFDIFIKQRSFAIINKVFFWLALLATAVVLFWPVIVAYFHNEIELVGAAVMQTMMTAAAAFFVFVYQQYKRRQTLAENIMRGIVFSQDDIASLTAQVGKEIQLIDQGFVFDLKKSGNG